MFDQKYVYETKLKELVEQLTILCNDNQIPLFITMAISDNDKETEYKSKILDSDFLGVKLSTDRFKDHLNVMNGFTTVYPEDMSMDFEF